MSVGIIDMANTEYAEYKCSACRKDIKSIAVQCKKCKKLFVHPGCVVKHKVYNSAQELVKCEGPYEEIKVESENEMKRKAMLGGSDGELMKMGAMSDTSRSPVADVRMDWLLKTVREMKEELVCKSEIKAIFREIEVNWMK